MTITGTGFVKGVEVTFGGTATTSLTFKSQTELTALTAAAPTGTKEGDDAEVVVTNLDGQAGTIPYKYGN